jgi:predicted Zn-dependent protease
MERSIFCGQDDEALAEFVAALLIDPRARTPSRRVPGVCADGPGLPRRWRRPTQALALDTDTTGPYALATSLMRLGRTEEGRKELEIFQRTQAATMANGQRQSALRSTLREAALHLGNGQYVDAAALLRQAVIDDPNASGVQRDLGVALMKSAKYGEAIQALDKALQSDDSAEVHQLLADAYKAVGRINDSEAQTAMAARSNARRPMVCRLGGR